MHSTQIFFCDRSTICSFGPGRSGGAANAANLPVVSLTTLLASMFKKLPLTSSRNLCARSRITSIETMDQPLPREYIGTKPVKLGVSQRPDVFENC
ncbi:hypothetical protein Bcep18194_B3116 [Burkholderia lata]|uniref:Uncharacterized protein n=1 Tax=Burkholderia lata (strain ATCC 17760 / DSM 23089 / LMG 22485 / NCIMB 9086 / R18194 / 383) TaxID=482957 RepID=Q38ZZ0_BURL3|nr:hypothetical protein Bcep18194_B3116 [Burkholderia lata]